MARWRHARLWERKGRGAWWRGEAVYEAAASRDGWPRASSAVAALTGAHAALLLCGASESELEPLAHTGLDDSTLSRIGIDLSRALHAQLGGVTAGTVVVIGLPSYGSSRRRGGALETFAHATGLGEAAGVLLPCAEDGLAMLWLLRRRTFPAQALLRLVRDLLDSAHP